MSIVEVKVPNAIEVVKPEVRNDSLDTFFRQAIGKEPTLSFVRAGDNPVQWIQLFHALDPQELQGWPLLTNLKVQMQKCEKCSREFCSPINYRRHMRTYHRLKKHDKDPAKTMELLGAFWDQLSADKVKEIVSMENVALGETPGSSVVEALTVFIRSSGFTPFPQVYLRAGSALLGIIHTKASEFPISSHDLFSILDDASETTFLNGPSALLEKFVFDGEPGKVGLEAKNLIAATSFLLEQKLVNAWIAYKDAEAFRCQKLLVEEEEAAQRRQADLLERKRQKKLKQKKNKAKDQRQGKNKDVNETSKVEYAVKSFSPLAVPIPDADKPNIVPAAGSSTPEPANVLDADRLEVCQDIAVSCWQVPQNPQLRAPSNCHANQISSASEIEGLQSHETDKFSRTALVNNRVWNQKANSENNGKGPSYSRQDGGIYKPGHEVLIGSISVTLGKCKSSERDDVSTGSNGYTAEHETSNKNVQEKSAKSVLQVGTNWSNAKEWRPVRQHESNGQMPGMNGYEENELDRVARKNGDENETLSCESCQTSCSVDSSYTADEGSAPSLTDGIISLGSPQFNCREAEAFLAQRWKEAIAGEHVMLVLSPDSELAGCSTDQ